MKLECNVGEKEASIRIAIGIVAIFLGFIHNPWWYVLGLVLIFTGWGKWCPLNTLFGRNSCRVRKQEVVHRTERVAIAPAVVKKARTTGKKRAGKKTARGKVAGKKAKKSRRKK